MGFLYLIRHARSTGNAARLLTGRAGEYPLDELGQRQARVLGERLRSEGIAHLRSSPLLRAVQTAKVVCAVMGIADAATDPDLVERDFGIFDGFDRPTLLAVRSEMGLDNADPAGFFPRGVGGVETVAAVHDRMRRAASMLAASDPDARLGVISHAGVFKAFLYQMLGITENHPKAFKIFLGSYVKCEVSPTHFTVHEKWINPT